MVSKRAKSQGFRFGMAMTAEKAEEAMPAPDRIEAADELGLSWVTGVRVEEPMPGSSAPGWPVDAVADRMDALSRHAV